MSHDILLRGCAPQPLAAYLKALGVMRLVAEQADPDVRGRWTQEGFVLESELDREGLQAFLLNDVRPTPMVTPWSGRGGFLGKPSGKGVALIAAVEASAADRLIPYVSTIRATRDVMEDLGLVTGTNLPADRKAELLTVLRDRVPDCALAWLDAAYVLTSEGPRYPQLLGTGGNDGSQNFVSTLLEAWTKLFSTATGCATKQAPHLLGASLFALPEPGQKSGTIGQFAPSASGNQNAGPGFDAAAAVNPWDIVLLLEGALCLAGSASRRLESAQPGIMSFPFAVRITSAGAGSTTLEDEQKTRHELWLPLWSTSASYPDVRAVFSEGRAVVAQGRSAKTGLDFVRALSTLGVGRGLSGFTRYGFQPRNGDAHLALPLGFWPVRRVKAVDLLSGPLDTWISRFRYTALGKGGPASLRAALRSLEQAIFKLARSGGAPLDVQSLLIALGEAESQLLLSGRHDKLGPIRKLPGWSWFMQARTDSLEWALAASLAESGFARWVRPTDGQSGWTWRKGDLLRDPNMVWSVARPASVPHALLQRMDLVGGAGHTADQIARQCASPRALSALMTEQIDLTQVMRLARGLSLLSCRKLNATSEPFTPKAGAWTQQRSGPLAQLAPFALAWHAQQQALSCFPRGLLPRTPGMVRALLIGDGARAGELSHRRLKGAGLRPIMPPPAPSPTDCARIANALVFPPSIHTLNAMARLLSDQTFGDSNASDS